MRFWDSSAVVTLLVAEATTPAVRALFEEDPSMIVWWATEVECASAIARLERGGELTSRSTADALERMDALGAGWHEIQPVASVRRTARRLLRVHPLRAADSLQLAAAMVASEGHPESLEIVSLDERMIDAARREAFPVADLAAPPAA